MSNKAKEDPEQSHRDKAQSRYRACTYRGPSGLKKHFKRILFIKCLISTMLQKFLETQRTNISTLRRARLTKHNKQPINRWHRSLNTIGAMEEAERERETGALRRGWAEVLNMLFWAESTAEAESAQSHTGRAVQGVWTARVRRS